MVYKGSFGVLFYDNEDKTRPYEIELWTCNFAVKNVIEWTRQFVAHNFPPLLDPLFLVDDIIVVTLGREDHRDGDGNSRKWQFLYTYDFDTKKWARGYEPVGNGFFFITEMCLTGFQALLRFSIDLWKICFSS